MYNRINQLAEAVDAAQRINSPVMLWPEDKGRVDWTQLPEVLIDTGLTEKWDLIGIEPIKCGMAGVPLKKAQAGKAAAVFQNQDGAKVVGYFLPRERCGKPNCKCDELNEELRVLKIQHTDQKAIIEEYQDIALNHHNAMDHFRVRIDKADDMVYELQERLNIENAVQDSLVKEIDSLRAELSREVGAREGLLRLTKIQAQQIADEQENSDNLRDLVDHLRDLFDYNAVIYGVTQNDNRKAVDALLNQVEYVTKQAQQWENTARFGAKWTARLIDDLATYLNDAIDEVAGD
jgi:DNA repair exonuclease SbcCD ATPase subunit